MGQIQNQSTVKEVRLATGLGILEVPTLIGTQVVPVINVNPKDYREINVVRRANSTTTGNVTVYTTNAIKPFYLSSINCSYAKNATADTATGEFVVTANINGSSAALFSFATLTLTAETQNSLVIFPKPIRLDLAAPIAFSGAFTVGAMSKSISITGTEVEPFENN